MKTLEKNIVRYRSIELIVLLYEVETVRKLIFDTLQGLSMFGFKNPLEGKSKKQYYEAAWEELRSKNILDAADIDELSSLINYRNTVAHKPEELLIDLNHEIAKLIPSQYDYEALSKIRNIKKRLHNAMHKHYPIPVDLHNYYMESIIDVLSKDLEKLRKKIDGQFARRLKLKSDVEKL